MHGVYNDLPYLPEIIKIKKVGNVEHDKKGYVTHNKLKTTLNPILVYKKVNKIIKLNQKHVKSYIDMNAELRENVAILKRTEIVMNKPVY